MEKRYQKVILQVEDGMWFDIRNGEAGELLINVQNSVSFSRCAEKYATPPIPKGYRETAGTDWQNGFTIERRFEEPSSDQFRQQLRSIEIYGGFYVSTYYLSLDPHGQPHSVAGEVALTDVDYSTARDIAEMVEDNSVVTSHLLYGAEYDSILEWIATQRHRKKDDLESDPLFFPPERKLEFQALVTGATEDFKSVGLYDFAVLSDWTQELHNSSERVVRDGLFSAECYDLPACRRIPRDPSFKSKRTGLRVALSIR